MPPSPTTSAFVSVNLDARKPIVPATKAVAGAEGGVGPNDLDVNYPDTYSHVQQFPLYDKLGQQHAVSLYFRRVNENFYNLYVNVDGQIFAAEFADNKITITMPTKPAEADAEADPVPAEGPKAIASFGFFEGKLVQVGAALEAGAEPEELTKTIGNLSLEFEINPPEGEPVDPSLLLSDPVSFKLDFSNTTNYASAFEVKRVDQDGYASGSLSGLSVDDKGFLRGQFTNGRTVVAGRLQLATFRGLGGLREVSNNTYQSTEQSGEAIVGSGAEGIFGSIRSNSVEEANTDMAGELVRLMVQQRNYQANAQSIRTQVEILSVTIDVTR